MEAIRRLVREGVARGSKVKILEMLEPPPLGLFKGVEDGEGVTPGSVLGRLMDGSSTMGIALNAAALEVLLALPGTPMPAT